MAIDKLGRAKGGVPRLQRGRVLNHLLLALMTLSACFLTALLAPNLSLDRVLLFGFGYTSMLLVGVSLLIGPLKLLKLRRNPINIVLRRDTGIWAALTGGLHVFSLAASKIGPLLQRFFPGRGLALAIHPVALIGTGGQSLLHTYPQPYAIAFGLDVSAKVAGLLAALLLVLLLVLSNNISMRILGVRRWKTLQRLNYLLFALALGHTLGYQLIGESGWEMVALVLGLTLLVLVAQSLGFMLYRARQRAAQPGSQRPLAG